MTIQTSNASTKCCDSSLSVMHTLHLFYHINLLDMILTALAFDWLKLKCIDENPQVFFDPLTVCANIISVFPGRALTK